MIRLIQFLIFGHVHKWKTVEVTSLVRPEQISDSVHYGRRTGQRFYQQCETCGTVEKRDLL